MCETCGAAYGDVNPANHTNLAKTEAKAATHLAEGNIEYWYCDGCGKYFRDQAATEEIADLSEIVIPKLAEHTPDSTGWHSDDNNHWNTCACGAKLNEAAHVRMGDGQGSDRDRGRLQARGMHGLRLREGRGGDPGDGHDHAEHLSGPDFLSGCNDDTGTNRFPGRDDNPRRNRYACADG